MTRNTPQYLTSAQVRAGDARAQGPAAAPFCLAELASEGVAGTHALDVGPDGTADASKNAEPASTISAEALFYR